MSARFPRPARGFTLVEAMVALLVLSIGLLGIAALYVETLQASRSALLRTQAVTLASDLADRIRSNRVPANAYACGNPCDATTALNAVAIADLTDWLANVGALLPGGTGQVAFVDDGDPNTPDVYTIQVNWTELGQASAANFQLRLEI
jgi:type IV pilus assembly protein PilV